MAYQDALNKFRENQVNSENDSKFDAPFDVYNCP